MVPRDKRRKVFGTDGAAVRFQEETKGWYLPPR